nr:CheR family methyltransferase [Massilia sp. IC2-477]
MDEPPESTLPDLSSSGAVTFPVVGIGASAGGLPALTQLLENLPPAPGMALVVVLHLAPDAPSAIDRVLQRATDMAVVQVIERVPLLPNRVYVISPGRSLEMEDGHLLACEASATPRMPTTINIFLRALAETHGEGAIGVLLSGMGTDGVAGLRCIKEHGGIVIVQVPDEAEESSMPQAAIDAGVADFVQPAGEIAARLLEMRDVMQAIHKGGQKGNVPLEPPLLDMGKFPQERLEAVLALLHAQTAHDFRHYKQVTVLRRIERRMQARAVPDLPAYHELLLQDPLEPDALVQEMLIGVTSFFRDREAFDALEQFVLPRICQARPSGEPVRAWVTACSTGEEAYSLAMLLAERVECVDDAPAMQMFATDIDERGLAMARAARYPETIAADVPPERLARHFTPVDSQFKVRRLLRERILFARHDLLHDPAFLKLDLITCRNVLIYLNREVHRHVLEVFHSALRPGGFLFLGNAESAELAADLFSAVNSRYRIYQAKPVAQAGRRLSVALPRTEVRRPAPGAGAPAAGKTATPAYAELHQRVLLQLAPPSALIDRSGNVVHASEGAGAFLRFAGGEPSMQLLALVPPDVSIDLRTALSQANESGQAAHTGPLRYRQDGQEREVALSVLPVPGAEGLRLVRFDPVEPADDGVAPGDPADPRVRELEQALLRARRNLEQTTEQAEAANARLVRANEHLQANVEELRADIEEFEIHREELQSRNEELHTINAELEVRTEATAQANDDLSNLIASTDIATLFLDLRLRIQRYTPSVTRIFNIIGADVGRPLADLSGKIDSMHLLNDVVGVFASGKPVEREARSSNGIDYIVRIHPYRTAYERIEGAVLTFFDISRRRHAENALRESEQRLATAFAALPIGIGILDPKGDMLMLNEVMRRFMPADLMPSPDVERVARWRGWDAAGAPIEPEDFPAALALRGESVLGGMQMLYTDDAGRETWTEVRSAPLLDGEGNITGALAVVIDVDRLKRSEEAARQSAQRQAFLLRLADAVRPLHAAAEIQGEATRLLREHLGAGWCYYVEWDEAAALGVVLRDAARAGLPSLAGTHDVSDVPEFLDIIRERTMLNVGDYANYDGLSPELRARYTALGFRSMLVATLVKQGRLVASLIVGGTEVCEWSGDAEALLREVAERTWAAIERSHAQAAAARAERRAESILERMSEAHCVLGPDYRILGVNAAAERLLDRERASLLGLSHWDAFPGSVDAPVGRALRRVVEEGVEQHFSHHYTGEGYDFHLEVNAYPTDEGGVAMFWRDVSDRLRAAKALQASEEKYRALFNEMDEAYAVVEVMADAEGRWADFLFLDANPAFMRHTSMPYPVGRTATQLLGTPNPRWAALYGRAVETGEPIRVEEGELMLGRVFDLNIFRLGGEGSRRVAVLFTDITERKRGEEALRGSEARFRALAEASPALIWQLDSAGALSYVNERTVDLTGATMDQLREMGWQDIVHPDDAADYVGAVEHALRTREVFERRVRLQKRGGGYRWFKSHARPWHTADGQFQGLVGMSLEVSDAGQAQDAASPADGA